MAHDPIGLGLLHYTEAQRHASRNVYSGKPLPSSRDIRILDIEPADSYDAPLHGTLRVTSLDSSEDKFQTLSYAWGDTNVTDKSLLCDGAALPITENLDTALRRIREKLSPADIFWPAIWVDAICINQTDESEKGNQVAMMGDIYARSNRLIIWLGEASSLETAAVRSAMRNQIDSPEVKHWLIQLFKRSWFRRRWVIQELAQSLPSARHALLGNYRFRFEHLPLILERCSRHYSDDFRGLQESAPLLDCLLRVRYLRTDSRPGNIKPSVMQNLIRFRKAECSSAHDRIYALLSISSESQKVGIDYTASAESVYIDFAETFVREGYAEVSLVYASTKKTPYDCSLKVPSWVPDWGATNWVRSAEHDDAFEMVLGKVYHENPVYFNTFFKLKPEIDYKWEFPGDNVLSLEGFLLRWCGHTTGYSERTCKACIQHGTYWSSLARRTEKFSATQEWMNRSEGLAIFWSPGSKLVLLLLACPGESDRATFSLHSCIPLVKDERRHSEVMSIMKVDFEKNEKTKIYIQ